MYVVSPGQVLLYAYNAKIIYSINSYGDSVILQVILKKFIFQCNSVNLSLDAKSCKVMPSYYTSTMLNFSRTFIGIPLKRLYYGKDLGLFMYL